MTCYAVTGLTNEADPRRIDSIHPTEAEAEAEAARLIRDRIVEALAHGLADIDAHDHPNAGLGKLDVRDTLMAHYRDRATRILLPRLHEAGLGT